jgi:hypothetical protein
VLAAAALHLLLQSDGPPLFYWGARPAVVTVEAGAASGPEARVLEVHGALDGGGLVLRFTFDRQVREAMYADGQPASGRLRAVLYVDADADRATGYEAGPRDPRSGADLRLELGVLALGEDAEEKRKAAALLTASLVRLDAAGRRRAVWTADEETRPRALARSGEWVEIRVPKAVSIAPEARLILGLPDGARDGRLRR